MCFLSKLEVGSSKAKKQQLLPKHSANAILKTIDANIFYPIEHLPFMSISVLFEVLITSL